MTVSLYQTGVSGLLAAQQQLAVTGNNIANANNEGYTRQRVEQSAAPGLVEGPNYLGSGTYVQDITRIYDQFSYKEQLLNKSNLGNADSLDGRLNQLNDVMSYSGQAINNSLGQFYQSLNGVADNPSDSGLRSIALSQADVLANDFRALNDNFDNIEKSLNEEITQVSRQISEISVELAQINEAILSSKNLSDNGQPNDLLDQRGKLINELGQYTRVTTVEDQNGVMTVMIGQGTTLVAGTTPLSVNAVSGDPDPSKLQLRLSSPNSSVLLDGSKLGGSLGASFEFRDEHLSQVRSETNRLAMSISSTLNDSQSNGLDLNAQQGANLFTDINSPAMQQSRVLTPSTNSGNLTAKINISDVSQIPTDEFEVRYNGTDFIMTNLTDKSTVNLGAPGTGSPSGTHTTAFGFEFIETSGTPSVDDSYIIRPSENGAALMEATLNNPNGIAASSAVAVKPSENNMSAGKVEIVEVLDPVNARLAMPIRIDVLESPVGSFNYTITDNTGTTSAPIAYTPPSQTIDLPASPATAYFKIEISGTPSGDAPNAPEQFFIEDAFGVGNNENMVSMAKTQEIGVTNGATETFSQSLAISTSIVGSKASSAELVAETSLALYTQSFNRNQSVSGVNLDEEAANLIKYQQAYQAASQIISVANTIFDTLLAAAR